MANEVSICNFSSYFFIKLCVDLTSRKLFLLYSINDTVFRKVNLIKKKLQKFFLINSLINQVPIFKLNCSLYIFLLRIWTLKISNNFINYKLVSKKFFRLIYIFTAFHEWEYRNSFKNISLVFKNEMIFSKDVKLLWKKFGQIFFFGIKKIFFFYNIGLRCKNYNKTFFRLKIKIFYFFLSILSNFLKWYYTRFIIFFTDIFNQLQILEFVSVYVIFLEKKLQLKHIKHESFILLLFSIYKCAKCFFLYFVLKEIIQESVFIGELHNFKNIFVNKTIFISFFYYYNIIQNNESYCRFSIDEIEFIFTKLFLFDSFL